MNNFSPSPRQDQPDSHLMAVDVAVLKEQMATVTANLSDMKQVNKNQSEKLDVILTQLSEAKGGWRTMMWLGGAFAGMSALIATWIGLFYGKHP